MRAARQGSSRHKSKEQAKHTDKTEASGAAGSTYMVPDRRSGLDEVDELIALCPGRTWNFVIDQLAPTCSSAEVCPGPRRRDIHGTSSCTTDRRSTHVSARHGHGPGMHTFLTNR
jgi:hypothetical protein